MSSNYDSGPIVDAFAVTKSDSAQPQAFRGFYVGGAGNVVITTLGGTNVTFTGCLAGVYYPFAGTHIKNATTATNIVGLR